MIIVRLIRLVRYCSLGAPGKTDAMNAGLESVYLDSSLKPDIKYPGSEMMMFFAGFKLQPLYFTCNKLCWAHLQGGRRAVIKVSYCIPSCSTLLCVGAASA